MVIIEKFNQRLVKKLGVENAANSGLANIFVSYKGYFKEMAKATKKIKGYPIKNTMRMSMTNYAASAEKGDGAVSEREQVDLSNLKGALGGMFGKKMASMAKKKTQKGPGRKQVFQFTHEITSIRMEGCAAGKFKVPAGYKRQAMIE